MTAHCTLCHSSRIRWQKRLKNWRCRTCNAAFSLPLDDAGQPHEVPPPVKLVPPLRHQPSLSGQRATRREPIVTGPLKRDPFQHMNLNWR